MRDISAGGGIEAQNDLTGDQRRDAIRQTRALAAEIVAASYPELRNAEIQVKLFERESDFFRTRFGIPQFFCGKMRFIIWVNPRVFEWKAPELGIRAIVAHELAHVLYFKRANRLRNMSLVRLTSSGFTARFERSTDLVALSRGYGPGLKEYRQWLYQHLPPGKLNEKRRNYFSPEEIDFILTITRQRPELLDYWQKHVPRDLTELHRTASSLTVK